MIRFDPEINVGTIITSGVLVVSVITFWVTQREGLRTLTSKLEEIRVDLKQAIDRLNRHDTRITVLEDREERE